MNSKTHPDAEDCKSAQDVYLDNSDDDEVILWNQCVSDLHDSYYTSKLHTPKNGGDGKEQAIKPRFSILGDLMKQRIHYNP